MGNDNRERKWNDGRMRNAGILFILVLMLCSSLLTGCGSRKQQPESAQALPETGIIAIVDERGGRVDWGNGGLIAHSRYGSDGYYDLWVMSPDGSGARCLTGDNPDISQLHNGQPTWHPSCNYIVFQSQDPSLPHTQEEDYVQTQPGFGKHNNLWATDPDGEQFYQLTHIGKNRAILHPHFSHDGSKLTWAERLSPKATDWAIMIADFVTSPEPHLANIERYQPMGKVWYETHAFSPDDTRVLFTAGTGSGSWSGFDIWEMEIASGELTRLTDDPDVWDEHAQYSPNGNKIVWASSRGYVYDNAATEFADIARSLKLDYWIMDADGSNKQRLTYFNEPGNAEYAGYPVIVADSSWSPDGSEIAATVLCGRGRESAQIVIIDVGEVLAGSSDESSPTTSPSAIYVPPHQKGVFEEDFFMYYDLPDISDEERMELALDSKIDWQEYCESVNAEAEKFSDELEDYIRAWYRGEADALLPEGLLPPNIDSDKTHSWTLVKPEDITAEEQWFIMIPAHETDPSYQELHMFGCDRHVTYVKLLFVAPIGSRLVVEGDFPHARFMDYEILSPFDPAHPVAGNHGSHPEVAIVDVDIEPDQGNTNPFRIGADRNVKERHYQLTFELEAGNAVVLNPEAMQSPEYRALGNTRIGGPFGFSGPWGDGAFTPSTLWLRIYAPDKDTDIMGGVSMPKAMLELDTGERFWLQPDKTLAVERQTQMAAAGRIEPQEPFSFLGPDLGWFKIFGLRLRRSENSAYMESSYRGKAQTTEMKKQIRDIYMLFFNRGTAATAPGNYESSATCCNYVSYLSRPCMLGEDMVYVITGKMPTTPATRDGEPVMTAAEARYWSISQYGSGEDGNYPVSVHYGSLMDDEITVNEDNEYVIVYSRKEQRPANANIANGVTWQDWGPSSRQTLTIRWMSIIPEWYLPEFAPDEHNIPWESGGWAEADYDQSLVGYNSPGIMEDYHPVIHYMTRQQFEALGSDISPDKIPPWK